MNQKQAFEEALKLTEGCSDQFRMGFAHGQKAALEWFSQGQEPFGEIQLEDMGRPFNALQVRVHFYKEVPPVGTKLYTHPAPAQPVTVVAKNATGQAQPAVAKLVEACKLLIRYHETADGVNMKTYFDAVKAAYSALKAVKES